MKQVMKLFDIMNDMKKIFVQLREQYQKNGYEYLKKENGNRIEYRLVNDEFDLIICILNFLLNISKRKTLFD
jgi:hypothetical protein